jgi:hypothetical protein
VVEINGRLLQMDKAQREQLFGVSQVSTIPTRDLNGDGINDLDQDNDGVWDGQDDYTPGPVSDDEILCGSGIRGDKMLEEGIQYEPYRADQAPGSAAFQSLFPNGLPPRSPVFCRSLNSLLALVGDAPDGTRQFVWHGALAGEGTDLDGDSVPDGVDNCPTVANQSQSDGDADGVGDACDNCLAVANPRVAADYLAQNPWATLTGGQRDDDHDGYGNRCDAKFTGSAGLVGSSDLAELRSSVNRSRTLDTCGATHDRPCAIFDLNEADGLIGGGDVSAFRAAVNRVPGPKCPTCPLTCTAGAQGSCN